MYPLNLYQLVSVFGSISISLAGLEPAVLHGNPIRGPRKKNPAMEAEIDYG